MVLLEKSHPAVFSNWEIPLPHSSEFSRFQLRLRLLFFLQFYVCSEQTPLTLSDLPLLPITAKTNDSFPPAKPLSAPGSRRSHLCRKLSEMSGGMWGDATSVQPSWGHVRQAADAWQLWKLLLLPRWGRLTKGRFYVPLPTWRLMPTWELPDPIWPLCMSICLPTLGFPCLCWEQPPCGPCTPLGCRGAAGVMLHTCQKPLIKLELSDRVCRSSCVINHCAAGWHAAAAHRGKSSLFKASWGLWAGVPCGVVALGRLRHLLAHRHHIHTQWQRSGSVGWGTWVLVRCRLIGIIKHHPVAAHDPLH